MWDKVRYFLKQFKSLEWSGPAWYSHVKDENGFPSIITLEYFHPLHLGTASETDWDGKELIKIYKPLRKEFPEIGKSWIQGNIHSHHSMGAFYSSTDEQQCIDGANENFYYSLVVSTKPNAEVFFGVSYPDQFGQVHIVEIDDIEVETINHVDEAWKTEAKYIKKNKKPETTYPTLYNRGKHNRQVETSQATLFGNYNTPPPTPTREDRFDAYLDTLSYNGTYLSNEEEEMTYKQWEVYDDLMLDYDRGRIKKRQLNKELKKIGVNADGYPIPS